MALATNSTPGSIVLAGDLTGVANAPELRVTGVVAGSYGPANIVVDSKGRLVYAKDATWKTDIVPLVVDATYAVKGIISTCDPRITIEGGLIAAHLPDALTQAQYDALETEDELLRASTPKGIVQVGSGLEVDNGVLRVQYASTTKFGIMKPGTGLDFDIDGKLTPFGLESGASETEKGIVQIGDNIDVTGGVISVKTATAAQKGVVQVGSGLSVTGGVMSWTQPDYPVASKVAKGFVEVGANIDVNTGVISVPVATDTVKGVVQAGDGIGITDGSLRIADATYTTKGLVQIDAGKGLVVSSGVLSVQDATATEKGVAQVGTNIDVSSGTISVKLASSTDKGVVRIGSGLDVTDGVVSWTQPAYPVASASNKGFVQITEGNGMLVVNGVLSINVLPDTTTTSKGIMQVGSGLTATSGELSVDSTILRLNANKTLSKVQTHGVQAVTGSPLTWDGNNGNLYSFTLSGNITLSNGTNINVGSYYHFIITNSATITYGSQFKFKTGSIKQPSGTKSVLSCYAVDANTLYCIMQPNFV